MMLGDILSKLSDMSDADVVRVVGGDSAGLARLRGAAAAQSRSPAAYVYAAVCRFLETATEEDWTLAMGRMRTSLAPGDELIALAIEQQLKRDGL